MPWCPKCGAEFREGFTICNSCQVPLVEKKPAPAAKTEAKSIKPVVLYTVTGSLEADMLCELLRREGIDAYAREQSLGQGVRLYTGSSFFGTDIIINVEDAARAQAVLTAYLEQPTAPVDETELARQALVDVTEQEAERQSEAAKTEAQEKRHIRIFRWLLTIDQIAALLFILLATIIAILNFVLRR